MLMNQEDDLAPVNGELEGINDEDESENHCDDFLNKYAQDDINYDYDKNIENYSLNRINESKCYDTKKNNFRDEFDVEENAYDGNNCDSIIQIQNHIIAQIILNNSDDINDKDDRYDSNNTSKNNSNNNSIISSGETSKSDSRNNSKCNSTYSSPRFLSRTNSLELGCPDLHRNGMNNDMNKNDHDDNDDNTKDDNDNVDYNHIDDNNDDNDDNDDIDDNSSKKNNDNNNADIENSYNDVERNDTKENSENHNTTFNNYDQNLEYDDVNNSIDEIDEQKFGVDNNHTSIDNHRNDTFLINKTDEELNNSLKNQA